MELLLSDTKPCPKCFSPIYKIEGCDQMWCTKCRTPFSWKRGTILTGAIHNPHAVRWQREHGELHRELRDVPCGGLVSMRFFRRLPPHVHRKIQKIHRKITNIEYILDLPYIGFDDLRRQFVLNEITEDRWKDSIRVREEITMQKQENDKIFQLLQILAIERFRDLAHNIRGNPSRRKMEWAFDMFILEMEQIRDLINASFKEAGAAAGFISSATGLSTPCIEKTWGSEGGW